MEQFYWSIVDIFADAEEFGAGLLRWWDKCVIHLKTECVLIGIYFTEKSLESVFHRKRRER